MIRPSSTASGFERFVLFGAFAWTAAVLLFLVGPLLVVVPLSFTSGTLLIYPLPGVSLQWYEDFFSNPLWLNAIRNSVLIGIVSTVAATALGTMAALGLSRAEFRYKPLLMALLVTPLVVPLIIAAVAMFFFYAWIGIAGTFLGLVMAHTALALPFVVVTVTATLQGFDANLSRAGANLGASPLQVFRRIELPIVLPGVVSGALFAFATSFDEIVVTIFVGGPEYRTLPRQIWSGVRESISPTVMVAAVVLFIVSMLLLVVIEALRRRGERLRGARAP